MTRASRRRKIPMAKIDRAAKVQMLADFDAQYAAFVTAGMDVLYVYPL